MHQKQRWYEPLSSFRSLSGWSSQRIAVGDTPDARTAKILFVSTVRHGWPSKNRIIFRNGEVFFISSQTHRGKKVFLFYSSVEIDHRLRRQRAENTILSHVEKAPPEELEVIAELVTTTANPGHAPRYLHIPTIAMQVIRQSLPDLSLSEVESITSLLGWPSAA